MTAKEYLSRPARLNREIQNDTENLQALRAVAESCTQHLAAAGIRDPSGSRGRSERLVIEICRAEEELEEKVRAFAEAEREALALIRRLPDLRQRRALMMRYIGGMPYPTIAEKLFVCKSEVFRYCRLGLKRLTEIGGFEPVTEQEEDGDGGAG